MRKEVWRKRAWPRVSKGNAGGLGNECEEPEPSSEPSSEVGASGQEVRLEALPRRCLALEPWLIWS